MTGARQARSSNRIDPYRRGYPSAEMMNELSNTHRLCILEEGLSLDFILNPILWNHKT